MTKIISCNIHDHFEIACMHRSKITLCLHNGETIQGRAVDLITKNKNEFIKISLENKTDKSINLLEINTLKVDNSEELIKVS